MDRPTSLDPRGCRDHLLRSWTSLVLLLGSLAVLQGGLGVRGLTLQPYKGGTSQRPPSLQEEDGTYTVVFPELVRFYGKRYPNCTISTNGVVAFGGSPAARMSRPDLRMSLRDESLGAYIAVFWDKQDGPSPCLESEVWVHESSPEKDPQDTMNVRSASGMSGLIAGYFESSGQLYTESQYVLQVTWYDMYARGTRGQEKNTYQLMLFTDYCQTYIALNYVDIEWTVAPCETDRAPRAGVSSGDGEFLELSTSGTIDIDQLAGNSNVNDQERPEGWFWFRVDTPAIAMCPENCGEDANGHCTDWGCVCDNGRQATVDCATRPSRVDEACDNWSAWSSWGACSKPCGGCGKQTRQRHCSHPDCRGYIQDDDLAQDCNVKKCDNTPRSSLKSPYSEYVYVRKNGKSKRIRKDRDCCYSFVSAKPKKLDKPTSCKRQKVKGFMATPPRGWQ